MVEDLKAMWRIVEGSMGIDMIIVRFKCVKAFNIIDLYYADPEDITRWKSQESRFQFNIRKKTPFYTCEKIEVLDYLLLCNKLPPKLVA